MRPHPSLYMYVSRRFPPFGKVERDAPIKERDHVAGLFEISALFREAD